MYNNPVPNHPPHRHKTILKDGNNSPEERMFPFYGGVRGKVLSRNEHPDGSISTLILTKPVVLNENQLALSGHDEVEAREAIADSDFQKIQYAAGQLVSIQEVAKKKGGFSEEDNKKYADSLYQLGVAAQNIAHRQQNGHIKDFSQLLHGVLNQTLPTKQTTTTVPPSPTPEEEEVPLEQNEEEFQQGILDESEVMPINDPYGDISDSVAVDAPKKDASVAESKPLGKIFFT